MESQTSVYAKRDVDYRKGELHEVCKNCVHFSRPQGFVLFTSGSCALIKGRIKEEDVCNLWTPNEDVQEED